MVKRLMRMTRRAANEALVTGKNPAQSLEDLLLEYAYELLLTSRKYKRTKSGYLMHRKDARLILANNIKINRFFFDAIIMELKRQRAVRISNQGVYLIRRFI
jgi:hypothetical protein